MSGEEIWKPVVWRGMSFSVRYEVSSLGRVRSTTSRPRVLKPSIGTKGYPQVCLTADDGRRSTAKVHRLVVEAFIGALLPGETVNHKDADKLNNEVGNLEVVTNKENCQHAHRVIESRHAVIIHGQRMSLTEALEKHGGAGVGLNRAYSRIHRHGWDALRAVTTPPMKTGRPKHGSV